MVTHSLAYEGIESIGRLLEQGADATLRAKADEAPMLMPSVVTTESLQKAIPGFVWKCPQVSFVAMQTQLYN